MYITPSVLKAEKGMGELLKQAAKELDQRNIRQLNKLGLVFLINQEVSAQEAVYRVLAMALKELAAGLLYFSTLIAKNPDIHSNYPLHTYRNLMIVTQIFIARISLIDTQPDYKH